MVFFHSEQCWRVVRRHVVVYRSRLRENATSLSSKRHGNCEGKANVHLQNYSIVQMIDLILPGMVERDDGIIVNVSSALGWRPMPQFGVYPASKAAVSFLSAGLYGETVLRTNVKIQVSRLMRTRRTIPNADTPPTRRRHKDDPSCGLQARPLDTALLPQNACGIR